MQASDVNSMIYGASGIAAVAALAGLFAISTVSSQEPTAGAVSEAELVALNERIQVMEDKEQISRLLYKYGTGLDTLEWEVLADIFTEDAEMVMEGPTGDPANALILGHDEFIATGRHFMTRLHGTQHVSTHHEIEIDGDTARSKSYMTAFHVVPTDNEAIVAIAGGLYTHEFERTREGWKISRMTDGILWTDPMLPQGEVLFGLPRVRGVPEDSLPAQ